MGTEAQTENDAEAVAEESGGDVQSKGVAARRERSTIEFPYTNLEDAEEAARAIFQEAGMTEITTNQVASTLNMSATSSGFRVRISALKLFGLIEADSQRVSLTELGRAIAEPHSAAAARVQSFLRVPLYSAVVERHDGRTLPPPAALERELVGLGVAPKMAERARQVFDRSAKHAGFIRPGSDRFVTPIVQAPGASSADTSQQAESPKKFAGGGGGDDVDPIIRALVEKIPPTGTQWPLEEQVQLLQMLGMAFHMIYKNKRPIKVSAEPDASELRDPRMRPEGAS